MNTQMRITPILLLLFIVDVFITNINAAGKTCFAINDHDLSMVTVVDAVGQ